MTQHYPKPIAPPPELVQQWIGDYYGCPVSGELSGVETVIAARAAQYGADQELKACCEWLAKQGWFSADEHEAIEELRAARRPKPPSLKEQALEGLTRIESTNDFFSNQMKDLATIRRALEQLDD